MMTAKSYGIQIKGVDSTMRSTVEYYRAAVKYIISISLIHYDETADLTPNGARRVIETLIHGTATREARYPEFDRRFYKMPSYLVRNAITTANAKVTTYKKALQRWEDNNRQGKRPHLNMSQDMMPCFYRGNMFKDEDGAFSIKVYCHHDWVWLPIRFRKQDVVYLRANGYSLDDASAPILEKRYHGYTLRFAFHDKPLVEKKFVKDVDCEIAIGVDLGLNNDAVCTAMRSNGTVMGSKFVNSPIEKDRLDTLLHKIRRCQQYGSVQLPRLYAYINNYNRQIAINTAKAIVSYAVLQKADVIVFENLSGIKPTGSKRQRIALWRKRDIQKRTAAMARRYGIRVSYICAKNTSKLAFDGSGKVTRDKNNYSMCVFSSGKRYNCDLSASKNIAARFFLRRYDKILKALPETVGLLVTAKVPESSTRTQCTLSTLISLATVMNSYYAAKAEA